ncbi:Hsp20 family protein [Arenicella sp. 4NH20-0111]|uniref:Hsp20 family protein n=1 Tax=Arenicella sp. 4NH20-0111 TaxID=3127648 RepID=UPI00310703C4
MNRIDLTPLYRSSVGYDRFGSLLDAAFQTEKTSTGYPPYNIEVVAENKYAITLALAGFKESELDIQVENGVLTVNGKRESSDEPRNFLHQGIANRSFERKFNLADHIEVVNAELANGLLTVSLVKEVPEAMKPKKISINGLDAKVIAHTSKPDQAA